MNQKSKSRNKHVRRSIVISLAVIACLLAVKVGVSAYQIQIQGLDTSAATQSAPAEEPTQVADPAVPNIASNTGSNSFGTESGAVSTPTQSTAPTVTVGTSSDASSTSETNVPTADNPIVMPIVSTNTTTQTTSSKPTVTKPTQPVKPYSKAL